MLTVLIGDALQQLRTLPNESVQCCVTSPPYWGLRDYGTAAWEGGDAGCDHIETFRPQRAHNGRDFGEQRGGESAKENTKIGYRHLCGKCGARRIDSQIGLEKTPEEYVAKMVEVFREVRRVLRKDGTLWLNLGDSYAAAPTGSFNGGGFKDSSARTGGRDLSGVEQSGVIDKTQGTGLKPKDLCGIPWRVAFELQADGWWLRSDIIWAKPNPMPESVTDRPTKSHEYLFLLTKSSSYFYDAEAIKENVGIESRMAASFRDGGVYTNNRSFDNANSKEKDTHGDGEPSLNGRNKRSVWTVATAPYPEAHFATYPPDLIKPCIMAGTSAKGCCAKCGAPWERVVEREVVSVSDSPRYSGVSLRNDSEDGRTDRISKTLRWQPTCKCDAETQPCVCLDPFAGSGTTGMVALELGRKAVLIELNPKYCDLIRQRCDVTPGLQLA